MKKKVMTITSIVICVILMVCGLVGCAMQNEVDNLGLSVEQQVALINTTLDEMKDADVTMKENIAALTNRVAVLGRELNILETSVGSVSSALEQEIAARQNDIDTLQDTDDELQSQITALEMALAQKEQGVKDWASDAFVSITAWNEFKTKINFTIENITDKIETLESYINKINTTLTDMQATDAALKNGFVDMTAQVERLGQDIVNINILIDSLSDDKATKDELKKIQDSLQSQIDALNTKIASLKNKVNIDDFPSLPYSIYKNNNKYEVEDILSNKDIDFTEYFVDTKNGSDSNTGLSESVAFRTLKKALIACVNKDAIITIIDDNAEMFFDDIYGNEFAVKHNLVIRAKTSAKIINGIKSPNFLPVTEYECVYVSDLSSYAIANNKGGCAIIDLSDDNIDSMGAYLPYTYVASIDDVATTAGTYYFDSDNNKMYVNPRSDIINVHPLISSYGFRFSMRNTDSAMLYFENLNIISGFYLSGRATLDENDVRINEFIANNCIFQHNFSADGVPAANFNVVYLIDCICAYPQADCYNYHATNLSELQILNTVYVEVNCQAEEAGYYHHMFSTGAYIMNLSTAHEGVNILRLNTTGRHAYGPMIADVNGCRTVCIDCHVFNSKYEFSGTNVACYTFNEVNANHHGKATLINCYGYDSRNTFYKLYSSVTNTEVRNGNLLSEDDFVVTGDLLIVNRHI